MPRQLQSAIGLIILGFLVIASTTERNHLPTFFGVIIVIAGLITIWSEIEKMILERRKAKGAAAAKDL